MDRVDGQEGRREAIRARKSRYRKPRGGGGREANFTRTTGVRSAARSYERTPSTTGERRVIDAESSGTRGRG